MNIEAELGAFLFWCAPRIEEVLDAGGVREVWLQGEAYRYFRFHRPNGSLCLYTNAHKKNDLAFYANDDCPEPMAVVEIKFYGLNYLLKNLTGYQDLRPYEAQKDGRRFTFRPEHAALCHPKESSLLKDYRKLLGQLGRRFLLLVLDIRSVPNKFGDAIRRVDFGSVGTDLLNAHSCRATLWEIN